MKLTRQRKVSIVLLTLAGIALAADRLVFGPSDLGPVTAAAETKAESAVAPRPAPAANVITVADRIEGLRANATASIDGFAAPQNWLPPTEPDRAVKPRPSEDLKLPALTSVFPHGSGGGGEAILNRKRVKVGEAVDGWMLERVISGAGQVPGVVIARGDQHRLLSIETPLDSSGQPSDRGSLRVSTKQSPPKDD